jgi:dihydrofolate reductase
MSKIIAQMTTSIDGYVTGPNDGPGRGLGDGGERLHYWVFGGPWSYDQPPSGTATGVDKDFLDGASERVGAVIAGRGTYEAAGAWDGSNPWGLPFFILTRRPEDQPPGDDFRFVNDLDEALAQATEAAGSKDVSVMSPTIIRQVLASGRLDEFALTIAPVVLGAGKRLFDGFDRDVEFEQVSVVQSPWATHLHYRVVQA